MSRMGFVGGLVAVVGASMLAGCAGESGADGIDGLDGERGATALTRVVEEAPGARCANGGHVLRVGLDADDDGTLDDAEVSDEAVICDGLSAASAVSLRELPVGDARCPRGGVAFDVADGPALVACNGRDGAQGAQGAQGDKGDKGETGAQGQQGLQGLPGAQGAEGAKGDKGDKGDPGAAGAAGAPGAPAPEVKLGQFLTSQVAKGLVVTCTSLVLTATTTECRGMKANGLDVYLAPGEANAICGAVTGLGYSTASGLGAIAGSHLRWSAATSTWTVSSAGGASPMQNLTCQR